MSATDQPSGPYRWAVLFGVWLVYFSFGLAIASMAPLVSEITGDLGISNAAMGAILGAWQLTYIAAFDIPRSAVISLTRGAMEAMARPNEK